jgi:hypothetical protein
MVGGHFLGSYLRVSFILTPERAYHFSLDCYVMEFLVVIMWLGIRIVSWSLTFLCARMFEGKGMCNLENMSWIQTWN